MIGGSFDIIANENGFEIKVTAYNELAPVIIKAILSELK